MSILIEKNGKKAVNTSVSYAVRHGEGFFFNYYQIYLDRKSEKIIAFNRQTAFNREFNSVIDALLYVGVKPIKK